MIEICNNDNLTEFGKAVLSDRYLYKDEKYQDLFARVAKYYSDDQEHAKRLYDYMGKLWFMPSTPILSNGGTDRGLPISCFLNETEDSLNGIVDLWNENVWLAAKGGGIGSYWGNLRSIGEKVRGSGKTSGIIPFIVVQNALTLAISQGSLRRGSSAVYLSVSHPEIEEFIDIRKPTGGDPSRKALNLHHAVVISDEFMIAVEQNKEWDLIDPHTAMVASVVKARDLWIRILTARIETGEPYMLFIDTVQNFKPEIYKRLNLDVKMSNLCSEITLTTGKDHLDNERTAVCCLASVNIEYFEDWKSKPLFIEDIIRFLDNVLDDFIKKAPKSVGKASYSALRERSIGLGAMGFHSFLQKKMVPFESAVASSWNKEIFQYISQRAKDASKKLAKEKGPCPDAKDCNMDERFTHKIAIAPTASISIICGNVSPGIEPYVANVFVHKTLSGSFTVRNKYLCELLKKKFNTSLSGSNTFDDVWSSITTNEGSIQHIDFFTDYEKAVFKTAYEIDQRWIIEHAAVRGEYICQSQSLNLFLPGNVHKKYLHEIHMMAWKKKLKSLYYCRSQSIQRPDKVSHNRLPFELGKSNAPLNSIEDECLSCQ